MAILLDSLLYRALVLVFTNLLDNADRNWSWKTKVYCFGLFPNVINEISILILFQIDIFANIPHNSIFLMRNTFEEISKNI